MKKLIILMLVLLAFSFLSADLIQYWDAIQYYSYLPDTFEDGGLTYTFDRDAVVFDVASDCTLNGVWVTLYDTAQYGDLDIKGEIWPVDANGVPDQSGMFPLASVTVPYADILSWEDAPDDYGHFMDFSAANLSFTAGQSFAFILTAPLAIAGTTWTCPLLDAAYDLHSLRYYTVYDDVPANEWYYYGGEFCFTADVTYTGDLVDMQAESVTFTGDFLIQPGDVITYEADVANLSTAGACPVTADVYLDLYAWDDVNGEWAFSQTIDSYLAQSFAFEDVLHFVFDPFTYPAGAEEYAVVLSVDATNDAVSTNNTLWLEQQAVVLPDEFDYDDGDSDTAHAFYDAGWGWANAFWYPEPVQVTDISFEMRDNTWPTGALGFLGYGVYPDDGTGYPDMTDPYVEVANTTCTLGAWNTYDLSALNIQIPAYETFYVAYFQVGAYQAGAPGLLADSSQPITAWATSYYYGQDDVTLEWGWGFPNATDEEMCIRAGVAAGISGVEAPIISITLDGGYPTIEWAAVTGALTYNVYGSNVYDPDPTTPVTNPPWTPLATGIGDLGYMYDGTEPYEFFYVTASSEPDGSKQVPVRRNALNRSKALQTTNFMVSDKQTTAAPRTMTSVNK